MYIIINLIVLFVSLGAGYAIAYKLLQPQLKQIAYKNYRIEEENHELESRHELLLTEHDALQRSCIDLDNQLKLLNVQITSASNQLQTLSDQSKEAADIFYQENMALAAEQFDRALEAKSQEYQEAIEVLEKELIEMQAEGAQQLNTSIQEKRNELTALLETLARTQSEVAAAVEAAKRAEEIRDEANFYRIQLSQEDINEIAALRSISSKLRNVEPLNKVIWKVYYEKPVADLLGRVVGAGARMGIYKITNIENQKCYVGQAVNIADRWKQHIKRGLGAETPTRNKLYPAMMSFGPENFTFEIIEECSRDLLDQQEDYWQDFYLAKEYGYSIK